MIVSAIEALDLLPFGGWPAGSGVEHEQHVAEREGVQPVVGAVECANDGQCGFGGSILCSVYVRSGGVARVDLSPNVTVVGNGRAAAVVLHRHFIKGSSLSFALLK